MSEPRPTTSEPAGWYPDPVGRHDFRFWSGESWSAHVADQGSVSTDPIEAITNQAVTVRPSWPVFVARARAVPAWRWAIGAALMPVCALLAYAGGGFLMVEALGAFGVLCLILLPFLYFRIVYIKVLPDGLEIRNQFGVRRLIPRAQIAAVSVGKAWDGGLTRPDFAFVVSPSGGRLARFYLQNWDPSDFRRVANGLGLQLYGRPGRALDDFHSAQSLKHVGRFYLGSWIAGTALGCALPLIFVLALVAAVLMSRMAAH
jgi:uncharacterized protein DUF2510